MTRQELTEIVLRGILLILSIGSIGAASAYLGALSNLCQYMELTHQKNHNTVIGTCEIFAYKYGTNSGGRPVGEGSLKFESKGTAYWVLTLSLVMLIYEVLALLQLYCKSAILNARKACCKSTATVFSIFDTVLMFIFSIGYFCGGLSAALLASIKWKSVINFYNDVKIFYSLYGEIAQHIAGSSIIHACDTVAGFAFFSMFFCIITVVYLLVARCVLKWPTHGAVCYEGEKLPN